MKNLLFKVLFLFLLLLIFPQKSLANSHPVINEVYYDPSGVNDTGLEWIKLYNPRSQPINLSSYQLNAYSGDYFTLPSFTLMPGAFVTIHWKTDGTDTTENLYTGVSGYTNMGDTSGWVTLFNSSTHNETTILDYIEYGAGGKTWESYAVKANIWTAGFFAPDVAEGKSIKLANDGVDNNLPSDWIESSPTGSTPTPTLSPTPISSSTATPIPSPTKTPTPKPVTPKPTISLTPTPKATTISVSLAREIDSSESPSDILGTKSSQPSLEPISKSQPVKTLAAKENNTSKILIGLGVIIILSGVGIYIKSSR